MEAEQVISGLKLWRGGGGGVTPGHFWMCEVSRFRFDFIKVRNYSSICKFKLFVTCLFFPVYWCNNFTCIYHQYQLHNYTGRLYCILIAMYR